MNIGFIGLGTMGGPMAGHLIGGGHTLFLHTRSGVPQALLQRGGRACASPREVARRTDLVMTMLPDTPDVERVLFGEEGVAQGLSPGKTLVDMSTISPASTREFAARIGQHGCGYVDAPVSGGDIGARDATLTIMVGAEPGVFEHVRPVLELLGSRVTRIGYSGAGQTCKLANQIVVALTIEAVGEALLFASRAGVDPARVREALLGGFAASRVLEVHGERMIRRAFDPGFRIELHRKDLALALSGAHALGLDLPNTAATQALLDACVADGGAGWDSSALVKALEGKSGHEIGASVVPHPPGVAP